ncbi:U-scoloptoxin(05)-Sm1a-like [Artemia franciscana]|uniref:U-scoloptoxin(05)-Sm1a-like n=1 Tax=Artemia franciscana TaxID=6661 RepID=UPI0032DA36CA
MRILVFIILGILTFKNVQGISCYDCTSKNGSDINCEDPVNPALIVYKNPCNAGKDGHIGEFPANFCIKIIGREYDSEDDMVLRKCTLESMDNQCGEFRFEDTLFRGCILTCDFDGCNIASELPTASLLNLITILTFLIRL